MLVYIGRYERTVTDGGNMGKVEIDGAGVMLDAVGQVVISMDKVGWVWVRSDTSFIHGAWWCRELRYGTS